MVNEDNLNEVDLRGGYNVDEREVGVVGDALTGSFLSMMRND